MSAPTEPSGVPVHEKLGRYEVLGEIASGGMATVFLGRAAGAKGFARLVAIKRLHPHLAHEDDFVTMFLDEARLAARIRHPNVVATLDVADQNGLYLVMEYIEGDRLLGLLRHAAQSAERIPPTVGLRIALDTLAGLQAAHELTDEDGQLLGLVHRDVSPQNILVGLDGVARLTDFGIAKATARLTVTRDGQLKGKIAYMAPEQTRRVEIDRRVDVFAMGIITWEMLTSKKLFTGESDVEVLNQLLFEPIPRVRDHAPGLPAGLDQAVMKALERDPVKRYNSAAEFADALERASRVFGGPANSRTVAAYVHKVAGERLSRDRARINAGGAPAPRGRISAPGFASTMTPSGVQRLPPPGAADAADLPHETLASYDGAPASSSPPPPLPARPSASPSGRPAVTTPRGPAVRARAPTLQGMAVPRIPGVTTPAVRTTPKPLATSAPIAPPVVRADISLVDDDEDAPTHAFGPAPMASALRASMSPASMPPLPPSPRPRAQTGSTPAIVLPPPDASVRATGAAIPSPPVESPPEPRRPSMTATQRLDVVAVPAPPVAPRANLTPTPAALPTGPAASANDPPVESQAIASSPRRVSPWLVLAAVCVLGASMAVGWQLRVRHHAIAHSTPRAHAAAVAHAIPVPLLTAPALAVDASAAVVLPGVVVEPAVVAAVADAAVAAAAEPPSRPAATSITPPPPPHIATASHPTHSAPLTSPTPHTHSPATTPSAETPRPVHPTAAPHPAAHPATEDDPFGSSNPYSR